LPQTGSWAVPPPSPTAATGWDARRYSRTPRLDGSSGPDQPPAGLLKH